MKAGVIDSGYRGDVTVIFANTGSYPITILPGIKIAQLVLLPLVKIDLVEAEELSPSERDTKGFGSSDNQE